MMLPYSDISLHVYFPGASDPSWLALDIPPALASRQSEMFAKYYAEHITNYRVGGKTMRVLRYYFGASRRKEDNPDSTAGPLRKTYQKLLLLRIKCGIFALPFEYYVSNFFIKTIEECIFRFIEFLKFGSTNSWN